MLILTYTIDIVFFIAYTTHRIFFIFANFTIVIILFYILILTNTCMNIMFAKFWISFTYTFMYL